MNFPQPQQHDPLLIALIASLAKKEGAAGQPPDKAKGLTLRALFLRHYLPAFLLAKPKSVELCITALNHLQTWMGHDPTLAEITPVSLAGFVRWLAARDGRSPKTATKNYRHLRAICGYAAQLELMPAIQRLRMPAGTATAADDESDVPAFTMPEIEAILGQAVALTGETDGRRDADLWVGLVLSTVQHGTADRRRAQSAMGGLRRRCQMLRRAGGRRRKPRRPSAWASPPQTAAYLERLRTAGGKAGGSDLALGAGPRKPAAFMPSVAAADGRGTRGRREGQGLSPVQGGHAPRN